MMFKFSFAWYNGCKRLNGDGVQACKVWSVRMWVIPLACAVRMMIGGTFQPILRISLRRGVYFMVLH